MAAAPRRPSDALLAFAEQYAKVLAAWAELFGAASRLVEANVALGRNAAETAAEFDAWMRSMQSGPWGWVSPDAFEQFLRTMRGFGPQPQ